MKPGFQFGARDRDRQIEIEEAEDGRSPGWRQNIRVSEPNEITWGISIDEDAPGLSWRALLALRRRRRENPQKEL